MKGQLRMPLGGKLGYCAVTVFLVTTASTGNSSRRLLATTQSGSTAIPDVEAYYTDAQAARGAKLFSQHCENCHFAEPDPSIAAREGKDGRPVRGFVTGSRVVPSNLGGRYILDFTWPRGDKAGHRLFTSVYYLFRELESMPDPTDRITQQARTDILAFLLSKNGFSPGGQELKFDLEAMKLMPLDGPGFVRLFNGRDFSGWKFLLGLGCKPAPAGCGRSQPGSFVTIRNGMVVNDGKTHGYMYTEKKYKNFVLRLDYRAVKPLDFQGPDYMYYANTGYLLFLQDETQQVLPKSIALAGEQRDLMKPVALDTVFKSTWDQAALQRAVLPLGEWNAIEIESRDGVIKGSVNGALISTVTQHEFTNPGYIGLQMQGYPIIWRNIRIKEE
jgi:hypothetical protein